MNVKDTIQALQRVIDELSYHPADTALKMQTDKLTQLSIDITVAETAGKVTVTIKQYVAPPIKPEPDDDYFYAGYP